MGFDTVQDVSPAEAREMIGRGTLVVDVRTSDEVARGSLPGALHIPYDELPERMAELGADQGAEILFFCHSGRRSLIARKIAQDAGFERAVNGGAYDNLRAALQGGAG